MRYLGGKVRLSKRIAASILDLRGDRDWYFEPFLGGGAVAERVAASFPTVILSDSHADLIAMWQAAARGWVPPIQPGGYQVICGLCDLRKDVHPTEEEAFLWYHRKHTTSAVGHRRHVL